MSNTGHEKNMSFNNKASNNKEHNFNKSIVIQFKNLATYYSHIIK